MMQAGKQTTNIINVATKLPEVEKFSNELLTENTYSEWTDNYELNCQASSISPKDSKIPLPLYLTKDALTICCNITDRVE